jgi:hypothetical protein
MRATQPIDSRRRRISAVLLFAALAYLASVWVGPLLHPAAAAAEQAAVQQSDPAPEPYSHDWGCPLCSLAASPALLTEVGSPSQASDVRHCPHLFSNSPLFSAAFSSAQARSPPRV